MSVLTIGAQGESDVSTRGPIADIVIGVSCIMLELFVRKPVFQGNDEIHQLEAIYEIMGTPTEEEWPGLASMPWYELVKPKEVLPSRFDEYFSK
jgi:CTD kinase subunit alpha